jgi:Dehydratase family
VDAEPSQRRARNALRSGAGRAPARSHFRAMGIDPDRLDGPIVGIASTWTETMPCNLNHRRLAERAAAAVNAAGGVPLTFNTIAVSDNQSQATPGMRASLVSREVIADSIELMVDAHDFDAVLSLMGCDKTVPAELMALARVDRPAVVLSGGPMLAGRMNGRALTIQDVWEAVGAHERGRMSRDELDALERTACPGPGYCAGNFTANTMAIAVDFLGLGAIGDGLIPAAYIEEKDAAAERAGTLAVSLAARGPSSRTFSTAARSRTRWPEWWPAAARRTGSSTCWRSPARPGSRSRSTISPRSAPALRSSPISPRAAGSWPRTCSQAPDRAALHPRRVRAYAASVGSASEGAVLRASGPGRAPAGQRQMADFAAGG